MKYTLEQCKKDMCQMWKWLSENPTKSKWDFISVHPNYPNFESDCAACHYDSIILNNCQSCPIDWGNINKTIDSCSNSFSPFKKWLLAQKTSTKAIWAKEVYKLALQIKVGDV